jgi:hypothetical protein
MQLRDAMNIHIGRRLDEQQAHPVSNARSSLFSQAPVPNLLISCPQYPSPRTQASSLTACSSPHPLCLVAWLVRRPARRRVDPETPCQSAGQGVRESEPSRQSSSRPASMPCPHSSMDKPTNNTHLLLLFSSQMHVFFMQEAAAGFQNWERQ